MLKDLFQNGLEHNEADEPKDLRLAPGVARELLDAARTTCCVNTADSGRGNFDDDSSGERGCRRGDVTENCYAADVDLGAGGQGGRAYKFKNDIRSRFCGSDETNGIESDGESCSPSLSNDSSTSSPPTDRCYARPASSFGDGRQREEQDGGNGGRSQSQVPDSCTGGGLRSTSFSSVPDPDQFIPGFALHPEGSFYIPVVTPIDQLAPFLHNYSASGVVCHPVNIPVNFGGPFVSMRVPPAGASSTQFHKFLPKPVKDMP